MDEEDKKGVKWVATLVVLGVLSFLYAMNIISGWTFWLPTLALGGYFLDNVLNDRLNLLQYQINDLRDRLGNLENKETERKKRG